MKTLVLSICLFMLASVALADQSTQERFPCKGERIMSDADYSVELQGETIILYPAHGHYQTIRITPEYELYVDNKEIKLKSDQQELVKKFHQSMMELLDQAKDIGWEGAKIGVQGAALGVKAVGSVFKLVLPGYDTDDLERELDRESAKIEAKAAKLEVKAKELEKEADNLKDLQAEMKDSIPELDELDWF
ncbi:exported hypothetical protein [Candidatus Zixiibacteriota bacterium]|nr:exported hypothetical protein [candidate division Zixibacteria bacterium]